MLMLLLKYHEATPASVVESQDDVGSARMSVDETDSEGNETSKVRAVYFDVGTFHEVVRSINHPIGAIDDLVRRKEFVMALWSELQAAASQIGNRTLTSLLVQTVLRSNTLMTARTELTAQVTRKSTKVTPGKAPRSAGGAGSSSQPASASKRDGCI